MLNFFLGSLIISINLFKNKRKKRFLTTKNKTPRKSLAHSRPKESPHGATDWARLEALSQKETVQRTIPVSIPIPVPIDRVKEKREESLPFTF